MAVIKTREARRITCFTPEQQAYYAALTARQRAYVDARGRGNGKADSYRMAGYTTGKNAAQNAYQLEKGDRRLAELIGVLLDKKRAGDVLIAESAEARRINALAEQSAVTEVLEKIDNDGNGELARQIRFFRDIADGKIKTVKKTVYKNAHGAKSEKTEFISDVSTRIQAHRELDRLLGITGAIQNLGQISAGGNVNIMIVDASKKDALEDVRNSGAFMDMRDKVEEVDGEVVIVTDKKAVNGRVPNVCGTDPVEEETGAFEAGMTKRESASGKFFAAAEA